MVKCTCGNMIHVNAGDSIRDDTYIWYMSYHCDKCGESIEADGYDIDSIPDDVKTAIVKREGEWGLKSLAGKVKIKFLINKVLQCKNTDFSEEIFFVGTQNQVKWVKSRLIKKGMVENDFVMEKL